MKVWICYELKEGPWGGGNQFLKALSHQWSEDGILASEPSAADVIFFNSHQNIVDVLRYKLKYPEKKFVHRVDGPIGPHRNDELIDRYIFEVNALVADGTVFQSEWSRKACKRLGLTNPIDPRRQNTILNAPDNAIFFPRPKTKDECERHMKIIATSWSPGPSKGHDVYQWLEQKLDPERYTFTFVGRSNENCTIHNAVPPMPSIDLANLLRSHDIYITASRNDPCSNSLIEAMHCGLPALGHKSGGHPEIIGDGGLLFSEKKQIPDLLDKMSENLDTFRQRIELPSIKEVAGSYSSFLGTILEMPPKPALTVSECRNMLHWIDRFHDRGKMRPLRKLRRRLAVWVEGGAGQ